MAAKMKTTSGSAPSPRQHGRAPARLLRPIEDAERMMEELMQRQWWRPLRWANLPDLQLSFDANMPRIDVVDRGTELLVRIEVPGVRREDVEVALTGSLLTVKGQVRRQHEEEAVGDYYHRETAEGTFSRSLTLPAEVDQERASARLEDGILEVTLPKTEAARRHAISID